MRKVWLEWTPLANPKRCHDPERHNTFVTDEKAHKPEAVKRCNEVGTIQAPRGRTSTSCSRTSASATRCRYWLGYEAVFERWSMVLGQTKIYSKMHDVGKKCTMHIFNTLQPSHVFVSGSDRGLCSQGRKCFICLKPAAPTCGENILQHSESHGGKLVYSLITKGAFFVLLIKKRNKY